MKVAIILLLSSNLYAQGTINHQGNGPADVVGIGRVEMGFDNHISQYTRPAMKESENDAYDKCGCGTLAGYDCIERVSPFSVTRQPDRAMFPRTWYAVAEAEFKCIK